MSFVLEGEAWSQVAQAEKRARALTASSPLLPPRRRRAFRFLRRRDNQGSR